MSEDNKLILNLIDTLLRAKVLIEEMYEIDPHHSLREKATLDEIELRLCEFDAYKAQHELT